MLINGEEINLKELIASALKKKNEFDEKYPNTTITYDSDECDGKCQCCECEEQQAPIIPLPVGFHHIREASHDLASKAGNILPVDEIINFQNENNYTEKEKCKEFYKNGFMHGFEIGVMAYYNATKLENIANDITDYTSNVIDVRGNIKKINYID